MNKALLDESSEIYGFNKMIDIFWTLDLDFFF